MTVSKLLEEYRGFKALSKFFEYFAFFILIYWLISQVYIGHSFFDRNLPIIIMVTLILWYLTKVYMNKLRAMAYVKLLVGGYVEEVKKTMIEYNRVELKGLSKKYKYIEEGTGRLIPNSLAAFLRGISPADLMVLDLDSLSNDGVKVVGLAVECTEVRFKKLSRKYQDLISEIASKQTGVGVKYLFDIDVERGIKEVNWHDREVKHRS